MFAVHKGRLLYAPIKPTGCVLRRTPIFAWALLDVLEKHRDLPDVVLPINCRDKPTFWLPDGPQPQGSYEIATTATSKDGKPALTFSYTTGHTFSDVPMPDYTFWGLPYARIRPWGQWLEETKDAKSSLWENKRDQMLWVGTTGVGNGKLGFSSHPLRSRFAKCGPSAFGDKLAIRGVAKETIDKLAWKCPPGESDCGNALPKDWLPLEEQCKYKIIVHLPGVSDWLEHFKHQLSCGSLNVYITQEREMKRRDLRREAEFKEPLTAPEFEHFDWWSPLLQAGVHYVHVHVKRGGRRNSDDVCIALKSALAQLEATPGKAQCIAERGQQLARSITMDRVKEYMAKVLVHASVAQKPEEIRKAAASASETVVTKRNLLRHASPSTRPWMEKVFLPWHTNRTAGGGGRAPSFVFS